MIWAFDLITLIFLVITAIISLQTKDLLSAAMIFGTTVSSCVCFGPGWRLLMLRSPNPQSVPALAPSF